MFGLRSEGSSSVLTFTVHEPPNPEADRIDRADSLEFVKDGFSWLTAIFPPLGFAVSGLWLMAIAYLVFVGALVAALQAAGVSETWLSIIVTAINIYLAFEHSTLKRWDLDRKGWRTHGVVTGKTLAECERRFLESWLPQQPIISATHSPPEASNRPETRSGWLYGAGA